MTDRGPHRGHMRREDSPGPADPYGEIIRVMGVTHRRFLIVSRDIVGYWAHWSGNHTAPCTEPVSECMGHLRHWPQKWRGFLHVKGVLEEDEGFLEITRGGKDQIDILAAGEESLRGMVIEVWRSSPKKEGHQRIQLFPRTCNPASLPEERDPTPHVELLWGHVPTLDKSRGRKLA